MNSLAREIQPHDSLIHVPLLIKIFPRLYTTKCFSGKQTKMNMLQSKNLSQVHSRNDGTTVNGGESSDDLKKVEAFVHDTYEKSKDNLMVLDIQGIGNLLYDPEIATEDIVDIDYKFLFCLGNSTTIQAFFSAHECNVSSSARVKVMFIFCWNSVPFFTSKKIFLSQNFLSFPPPYPFIFLFLAVIHQNTGKPTNMNQADRTSINKIILHKFLSQIYILIIPLVVSYSFWVRYNVYAPFTKI